MKPTETQRLEPATSRLRLKPHFSAIRCQAHFGKPKTEVEKSLFPAAIDIVVDSAAASPKSCRSRFAQLEPDRRGGVNFSLQQ